MTPPLTPQAAAYVDLIAAKAAHERGLDDVAARMRVLRAQLSDAEYAAAGAAWHARRVST